MDMGRCNTTSLIIIACALALFCFGVVTYSRYAKDMDFRDDVVKAMHQTRRENTPVRVDEVNPVPTQAQLDRMSVAELSDFFHGYVPSTQVLCNRVLRFGKLNDGGWDICDDPRYTIDPNNCLVYSFGIANDFSYDDALETFGCEVHAYDPSMKAKDHLRGKRVHFHPIGIGRSNTRQGSWDMGTLGNLRGRNGHQSNKRRVDVVKMDVEGSDLAALQGAIEDGSLHDVRQLSFETHIYTSNGDPQRKKLQEFLNVLRTLWDLGFRLYFTNRNDVSVNIYRSKLHGVYRTACHELNMVNINLKR